MTIDTLLPPENEDFIRLKECVKDKGTYVHKRTSLYGLPALQCMGPCDEVYLDNRTIKGNLGEYN